MLRNKALPAIIWTVLGGGALCLLATLQGLVTGVPVSPALVIFPTLLGSMAGLLVGLGSVRLRDANQRLLEAESHYLDLYQNTPAMLHSIDQNGLIVYVSQTWLSTLGYQRKEVVGRKLTDFLCAESQEALETDILPKLIHTGQVRDVVYRMRKKDNSEIDISLSAVAEKDSQGKFIRSLEIATDLTARQMAEAEIEKLAYFDSLTGLPNRDLLTDRLHHAIAQARRDNHQVAVLFFDLDRFKEINDTQGHAVGDLVLQSVAAKLKSFLREGDTFARLGGDEFVIIQADPIHDPNAATLSKRVLETLAEPFTLGERSFYTTASIGLAVFPIDGEDPHTLLKNADTAMYAAKNRGRNNFQYFSAEMNARVHEKHDLETKLRHAIEHDEIELHYQPQVDLATGQFIGIEALLRWEPLNSNLVPPKRIISIAEESGLIYPLGKWILKHACAQTKAWLDAGLRPARIGVNMSGHQIRHANFIDQMEDVLEETGLGPEYLEIELAETSVMEGVSEIIMSLTDLQVRGISLAVDDFGTGYSSLIYLKHLPIHRIKIASEFIKDITHDSDYAAITEAIIVMAKSLKLRVTAVGVENQEQVEFLQARQCTEIQGSLLSSPLPTKAMTRFLEKRLAQEGVLLHPKLKEQTNPVSS